MIIIKVMVEWTLGGCCGCDSIYTWEERKVTPQELVRLINRCETIKL